MSLLDPRLITGNRAKVEETALNPKTERSVEAQRRLTSAGELLAPQGAKYLGSAAVHFYAFDAGKASGMVISGKDEYATVEQTRVDGVNEGLADFGWKQLQKALMKAFGRTPPRTVKR